MHRFLTQLRYFALHFFAVSFLFLVLWIGAQFHDPEFEYILFNIQVEKGGFDRVDINLLYQMIGNIVILPIICVVMFKWCEANLLYLFRDKCANSKMTHYFERFFYQKAYRYIMLLAVIVSCVKFNIVDYVANNFIQKSDYVAQHYLDPNAVVITAQKHKPKNLILIYVEGLETQYGDKAIFGKNLIARLEKHKALSFARYKTIAGNTTIASIISTQCAIPLNPISFFYNYNQRDMHAFLPSATCLGQTLKQLGYHNVYLGGADVDFADKRLFLKTHGYDDIYGRTEWMATGKYDYENMQGWGLYDADLFSEAKVKLDALMAQGSLFNLTLLTLDTHGPQYSAKGCQPKGSTNYDVSLNESVQCSTTQVAKFIEYVKKKNYLNNTNIVVIGDHYGPSPILRALPRKDRLIYNSWISNRQLTKNREDLITLDIAPSIIEFLGFDLDQGRYGLGYSAFSRKNQFDAKRIPEVNREIKKHSDFYLKFWQ